MSDERTRDVVELPAVPAIGPMHRRAVLGALPLPGRAARSGAAPGVEVSVRGVTADRSHLAEYDRVCGFPLTDQLPATYPHIMAFPLAMRLMTAPEFPIPLVGIVHVANRITLHRPIDAAEALDLSVYATDPRPHERGRQLDVVATASVDGEVCWRGVSTYLSRERGPAAGDRRGTGDAGGRGPGDRPPPPAASAEWRVEPSVGTAYARASGDHNPIHTSRLLARLFGFPRPIAHGMWSKARCLAALTGRLPEAYTVEVAFKLPVPLPSTVAFSARQVGDGWDFGLHDARSGRPHLAGGVRKGTFLTPPA